MEKQIKIVYSGAEVRGTKQTTIVAGSVESVYAEFVFDSVWDKYAKKAIFMAGNTVKQVMLDDTNTCKVPWEVLTTAGTLVIGVIGQYETEIFPSLKATFSISYGYGSEGDAPAEPTQDLYDEIVTITKNALDAATALREDAANGVFDGASVETAEIGTDGNLMITLTDGSVHNAGKAKGDKGEQGPQGEPGKDGADGKDGSDYILTDDDKQELSNIVMDKLGKEPGIEETVLAEQTVAFEKYLSGTFMSDQIDIELSVGEKYRVVWNGTEYFCYARDASELNEGGMTFTGAYIGNAVILTTLLNSNIVAEGTGEPFIYFPAKKFITSDTAESHVICVQRIKTLNTGWLPDLTDYILTAEDKQEIADLNKSVGNLLDGVAEGSLKQANTTASGKNAIALGDNTKAGCSAYRIISYDGNKTFTLWDKNGMITSDYAAGDVFSVVFNNTYDLHGKISSISVEGEEATVVVDTAVTLSDGTADSLVGVYENDSLDALTRDDVFFVPDKPLCGYIDITFNAYAEGENSQALNYNAHAEGKDTRAVGRYAHAEGKNTVATHASHAEGQDTQALGRWSHAEGVGSKAIGARSHAEGVNTSAGGDVSHAEGQATIADGTQSHAEGYQTRATAAQSHAEGYGTYATNSQAHAEGMDTAARGQASHTEGISTSASADGTHAEGSRTTASGKYSHAEGYKTKATGWYSHAEGAVTNAGGDSGSQSAHAEGQYTIASGIASHAEGGRDISGSGNTIASGDYSHAEGYSTASGEYSHAEGYGTIANGDFQHVQGKYNIKDSNNEYAHILGNGTSNTEEGRSNAHTIDWSGNAWFAGDITIGADNDKLATQKYVDDQIKNLPVVSADDNGKILQVVDGKWAAVAVQNVSEVGM